MELEQKEREAPLLPRRLQQARRAAGLSQEALAERLEVSRQAVSKWESGQAAPAADKLPELARALGTTVDARFGGAPAPESPAPPVPAPRRRRTGILAGAALGLALVTAALLAVTAVRLARAEAELAEIRRQLSSLAGQLGQLAAQSQSAPAEDQTPAAIADFAWEITDYDAEAETAAFSLRATPRTQTADTAAVFLLTGSSGEPRSVSGTRADWGGFTAEAVLPLSLGQLRVDLALTDASGETVTETAGWVPDLQSEFPLDWALSYRGRADRVGDRVTFSGPADVTYNPGYAEAGYAEGSAVLYPVSGTVTLTMGDRLLDQAPLDFSRDPDDARDPEQAESYQLLTGTASAPLQAETDWTGPVVLTARVTDNFGNTSERSMTFFD